MKIHTNHQNNVVKSITRLLNISNHPFFKTICLAIIFILQSDLAIEENDRMNVYTSYNLQEVKDITDFMTHQDQNITFVNFFYNS